VCVCVCVCVCVAIAADARCCFMHVLVWIQDGFEQQQCL
jgi:hypothetical protein